jgi:hypothetical protein
MHWWVLPAGPGTDVSTRTASGGSIAVLYQNELHDWRTTNHANPYFARLGVLFGKPRVAFVLEPLGTTITSDFARAHVLVGGSRYSRAMPGSCGRSSFDRSCRTSSSGRWLRSRRDSRRKIRIVGGAFASGSGM